MQTKTQTAINLWNAGKRKEALGIFKTFKIGLTADDKRILQIAHAVCLGTADIYSQMGVDLIETSLEAEIIINQKFISNEK